MKIILQEEVPSLGSIGDLVNVKAGYARNYLFPKNLAVIADKVGVKQLEQIKKQLEVKRLKKAEEAKGLAGKIEGMSITINKKVGEEEKIFGTVTSQEIADLIKEEGIEISKKQIQISEEIKKIGVYHADITLEQGIKTKLKFWVVSE